MQLGRPGTLHGAAAGSSVGRPHMPDVPGGRSGWYSRGWPQPRAAHPAGGREAARHGVSREPARARSRAQWHDQPRHDDADPSSQAITRAVKRFTAMSLLCRSPFWGPDPSLLKWSALKYRSTSSPVSAWLSGSPARLEAADVIDVLSDLFIIRGVPGHIRSDNVLCREGNGLFGQQISDREFALAA